MVDYCTAAELEAELGISDSLDGTQTALAVSAASSQIESYCGRRFWQDSTVVVREFYPESPVCVDLLDQGGVATEISTTTGLIVKVDGAGDGTFSTTWTISTDFILLPRNAVADESGFHEIRAVNTAAFPNLSNGRAAVQVTAKFGWPAVPVDVKKACLVQAAQLFKSKDAVFGAMALGDSGALFVKAALNPTAKALLAPFQVPPVG